MKTTKFTLLGVVCLFVFFTSGVYAQVDTTKALKLIDNEVYKKSEEGNFEKVDDELFELDLEALLNMEISTVSKKAQSISDAPAIVTTITEQQILEYGAQTLTELMTFVPGFSVKDSYWKRQIVTARGVSMSLYNDKILMLINGIPAYGAAAMEHFLDLVPVTSIRRIEIIRGPGSTLYGTNAFSAVINIITKKGDTNAALVYAKGGSFGTSEAGFSYNRKFNSGIKFHLGTSFKNNDGYLKEDIVDEYGVVSDILYEHDNNAIFSSLTYKQFSLQTGYLNQTWSKFGPLPGFRFGNMGHIGAGGRAYHEKYFINGIYENQISEKLNAKVTLHLDNVDKQSDLGDFGQVIYQGLTGVIDNTVVMVNPDYYQFSGYLFQGEAHLNYALSDKFNIMGGVSGESRTTTHLADLITDLDGDVLFEGSTKTLPFSISDFGGYLQVDGSVGGLGFVAGVRASYLGISEKFTITPRVGLIYKIEPTGTSLKALYGQAFRGAGPQEQYYKVPILIYGLDAIGEGLNPEKINTIELAVDQKLFQKYKLRINGFWLDVTDLINRRPATAAEIQLIDPNLTSTMIYDNLGEKKIMGAEIEITGYPTDYLNFWANFSYKDGEVLQADTVVDDYLPFIENVTANAGITLKLFNSKLAISPNFQYVGEREGKLSNDSLVKVDAYSLLNLRISYNFTKNVMLSFYGQNLLDEEYFYPEDVRRNIAVIPGGPGTSMFVELRVRF